MRYAQSSRLDRIYSQTFYLIEREYKDIQQTYEFKVSGSTANLYTVTFKMEEESLDEMMGCNCPDMFSHAKSQGVKCKHCCFVWVKVLNLIPAGLEWFGELNGEQVEAIEKACQKSNTTHLREDLVNQTMQMKYHQMVRKDNHNTNGKKMLFLTKKEPNKFMVTKDIESEDLDCPICFDELKPDDSSQCPTCRNVVHTKCIRKWLSTGHRNCVYCRGDWSEFDKKKPTTTTGTKQSGGYLNLS